MRPLASIPIAALLLALVSGPAAPARRAPECTSSSGRVVRDSVPSRALVGNHLGDPATRSVLVYLPPGYDAGRARYPVVYLLHAYGAGNTSWLGESGYEGMDVARVLDSLGAASAIGELIVVMPDARTKLGGSWYANSATAGRWEDFIAEDLVAHVDARYRTLARASARGLAGQSMGAYGALRIAARRPDVFGAVYAVSVPHVSEPNPFGERAMSAALDVRDDGELARASPPARLLLAKAAAFAPNPARPPFYGDLPVRRDGDRVAPDEGVRARWASSTLLRRVDADRVGLRRLAIRIDVGESDALASENEAYSRALDFAGVEHRFERFPGGHVAGVRARFEREVFQYFSGMLR